ADLDALDGLVEAERLVAVEVAERRIVLDRHAVLQQLHRAESIDWHAARADVAARLATRSLHPEAGHRLHRLGDAGRRLQAQGFFFDVGDRVAGLGLGAEIAAGAAGNDDRIEVASGRIARFRRSLLRHGAGARRHDRDTKEQDVPDRFAEAVVRELHADTCVGIGGVRAGSRLPSPRNLYAP